MSKFRQADERDRLGYIFVELHRTQEMQYLSILSVLMLLRCLESDVEGKHTNENVFKQ